MGVNTTKYKQTELGLIPEDWDVKKIGEICTLINGRGFKPFEWKTDGLPIIRIQNLNGSDNFNYYQGDYDKKLEVESGQLLFAWSGSRGTSFGPHIWNGNKGLLNYHTWKIVIHENEINKSFFNHALNHITKLIEDKAHGASALVHTQKWEMEGFEFALPSLKEQTAIANALSEMDALIDGLEELIAKKKNLKQGALQKLLKPKEGWVKRKLGEVLEYEQPVKYLVNNTDYTSNGQTPVLTVGKTFILGYTDENEGIYYNTPVIIFDDFTTQSRYVDFSFKIKSSAIKLLKPKSNKISLRFVFEAMQHIKYDAIDHKRHWIGEFQAFEIELPSYEEQNEIVDVINDMTNEYENLLCKLSKTKQLKQGMMQNLLTGKIRLV
jgi:type I restriction enzyme, S subunit